MLEKNLKELNSRNSELWNKMNSLSNDFVGDNCMYLDSSEYITDAFSQYADNRVDIYYSDLKDWLCDGYNNITLFEEAVNEFGYNGFYQSIMQAQYLQNDRQLNDDVDYIIEKLAIEYVLYEDIDTTLEDLQNAICWIDYTNRLEDIKEAIEELREQEEEEKEEE